MRCFIIIILVFSSALLVALALQCSKIVLVFLAGLFVSSCSIFLPNMVVGNIVKVGGGCHNSHTILCRE